LNAAPLPPPTVEDAAERRHLEGEIAVLDRHVGPDGCHNLCLRENLSMPLDEHAEQIESAPADRRRRQHPKVISPEQAAAVELEPREQENVASGERAHLSISRRRERSEPRRKPAREPIF
jgi:hypothetical protein